MGPVEALKVALGKEQEAINLYTKIGTEHTNLKEIMDFLIGEEHKHKQLLDKKIAELTKY